MTLKTHQYNFIIEIDLSNQYFSLTGVHHNALFIMGGSE